MTKPSRRGAIAQVVSTTVGLLGSSWSRRFRRTVALRRSGRRRPLGTVPLSRTGAPEQPYGVKFGGRGLDARLITDLSRIEPGRPVTPNPRRSSAPSVRPLSLDTAGPGKIKTSGLLRQEGSLTAASC